MSEIKIKTRVRMIHYRNMGKGMSFQKNMLLRTKQTNKHRTYKPSARYIHSLQWINAHIKAIKHRF